MDDENELELVETEKLLAELHRRADMLILMGAVDRGDGVLAGMHTWKGDSYSCVGMADDLKTMILQKLDASRVDASGL